MFLYQNIRDNYYVHYDNFRAIILGSIVAKLFDIVILSKEQNALATSHLQFGIKQNMSTTHCTYVMMETISYYNANGSNVYALMLDGSNVYAIMLDASKTFYRFNYCKLFRVLLKRKVSSLVLRLLYMYTKQKHFRVLLKRKVSSLVLRLLYMYTKQKLFRVLLKRKVSPLVLRLLLYMYTKQQLFRVLLKRKVSPLVLRLLLYMYTKQKLFRVLLKRKVSSLVLRLLLYMYTKQKLQVRWCFSMSSQFTACNGVKQGAILSPILFSIYMDGLFEQLEKSGVGCHMSKHYTGCFGYADDLALLTPTKSGFKVLLDICEKYAHEYCYI